MARLAVPPTRGERVVEIVDTVGTVLELTRKRAEFVRECRKSGMTWRRLHKAFCDEYDYYYDDSFDVGLALHRESAILLRVSMGAWDQYSNVVALM